jgi:hypothetical protein
MTVTDSAPARTRTRTMRVPRSRGAVSGLLLILLGAWGALIPFIGPYLDYSYGTDQSWHWTAARGWLEVLPGAVTAFGGLLVLISANRIRGSLGGWLAAIAGAWFVVGQTLAPLLHLGNIGQPLSQTDRGRAAAQLGYFYGLGVVILFLAAFALGRLAVVGVRDLRAAERDERLAAEQARAEQELARRQALDRDAVARTADDRTVEARNVEDRTVEDRTVGEHATGGTAAPGSTTVGTATGGSTAAAPGTGPRDARYEPDRPYAAQGNLPDEPTTRYNSDVIGSDYGSHSGPGGRPPAHQAPGEETR